jgi:hypothetical protein
MMAIMPNAIYLAVPECSLHKPTESVQITAYCVSFSSCFKSSSTSQLSSSFLQLNLQF